MNVFLLENLCIRKKDYNQMCCNRIDTDSLMANLFAVSRKSGDAHLEAFSLTSLGKYLDFLSERFPVYVASDFSKQAVDECIAAYPDLYQRMEDETGELVVRSGKLCPNLDYFNASFSENISTFINNMTKLYLNLT